MSGLLVDSPSMRERERVGQPVSQAIIMSFQYLIQMLPHTPRHNTLQNQSSQVDIGKSAEKNPLDNTNDGGNNRRD